MPGQRSRLPGKSTETREKALVAMTERRDELVAQREAALIDTGEPLAVEIVKLPPDIH